MTRAIPRLRPICEKGAPDQSHSRCAVIAAVPPPAQQIGAEQRLRKLFLERVATLDRSIRKFTACRAEMLVLSTLHRASKDDRDRFIGTAARARDILDTLYAAQTRLAGELLRTKPFESGGACESDGCATSAPLFAIPCVEVDNKTLFDDVFLDCDDNDCGPSGPSSDSSDDRWSSSSGWSSSSSDSLASTEDTHPRGSPACDLHERTRTRLGTRA